MNTPFPLATGWAVLICQASLSLFLSTGLRAEFQQQVTPAVTVSAKTLTPIHCEAKGKQKAVTKDAVLGKKITKALKVATSSPESRVDVTAGHWTRDTPNKLTCMVYVSNLGVCATEARSGAILSIAVEVGT